MLKHKTFMILVLTMLFASVTFAQDQYPPSGIDVISTSAKVDLYDQADSTMLLETLTMYGYAEIWRSDPYDDGGVLTIDTRMDTLLLRGYSISFGDSAFITLNRDSVSVGQIYQITPGIDFPAESFFDVFYQISFGSETSLQMSSDAYQGRFDFDATGDLELITPQILLESTVELKQPHLVVNKDAAKQVSLPQNISAQLSGPGNDGGGIYADQPFNMDESQFECDPEWIDHSGGNAFYFWSIPQSYGINEYGETFESSESGCCRLDTAWICIYPEAFDGTPDLVVNVYADDGSGMPGSLLATETVPYASLPTELAYVDVDFMSYNLMFCYGAKFHIGVQWTAPGNMTILSDDGSTTPLDTTSWAYYEGYYYSLANLFGEATNWDYLITARVCCEPSEPLVLINHDPAHMWDEIWQIPPYGRVYNDPHITRIYDKETGEHSGFVSLKHIVDPPPTGVDEIPTIGLMDLWVGPAPPGPEQPPDESFELTGDAIVIRSNPYYNSEEKKEIQTEIVSMDLTGESALFGLASLYLPFPAPGLVIQLAPGDEFFPAESFFDVYYQIDFPWIGMTLSPMEGPPRMSAEIEALPPYNRQYTTNGEVHPLHDVQMPGIIFGWVRPIYWMNPLPEPTTCCIPLLRGNINYDPPDVIDISDLVYLVDYMFTGGPPPVCFEEVDMNCDSSIDIADLVYLVDYMFNGGPQPCRCDCADCR